VRGSNISRGGDYRIEKPVSIGDPNLVQSWPFKEPEKKSAWNDNDREGPKPMAFRDPELEKAEKRTRLIKERMSPPGALHLPPLLEEQRLKWGITDGFFRAQASFDRIFVFPVDQFDDIATVAAGSPIIRPELKKLKDLQEGNRGVLISAGLTAADRLASHGIELGHMVITNKNVPFARRCDRLADGTDMFYLVMRDADLAGSETLGEEIRAGKKRVEDAGGLDGYEHQVASNDNGEWTFRKKQSVYINDTW
jgi:hypothetical protein